MEEMRDFLKIFYGAIKPLDFYRKLALLTGVIKISITGIFSGLNNLRDITLNAGYSALCGYTHDDLKNVFREYIEDLDVNEVKNWYNRYSRSTESVYNPFDILLFLEEKTFKSFWFETGTPSFFITLWQKKPRIPSEFDGLIAGDELLGSFDPDNIRTKTLLFQAGYLTIRSFVSNPYEGTWYTMRFPNREVREVF